MTCSYCGTRNNEGEHRCRRCGRKPDDTLTNEFNVPHTTGALATQPVLRPKAADLAPPKPAPNFARAYQRPLFQDGSHVIPIGSVAPPRREKTTSESGTKPAPRTARRTSRVPEGQGSLDFL